MRLRQDLSKKQHEYDTLTNSELSSLKRKIGVLYERAEMYNKKNAEFKGLSLQIQSAETKLRKKSQQLAKLEAGLKEYSYSKKTGLSNPDTTGVVQQIKSFADKNEQLQKVTHFLNKVLNP